MFSITRKLLRSVPAALPKSTSRREPSVALAPLTAWKLNEIDWPSNAAPVSGSPAGATTPGEYGPPKAPFAGSLEMWNT